MSGNSGSQGAASGWNELPHDHRRGDGDPALYPWDSSKPQPNTAADDATRTAEIDTIETDTGKGSAGTTRPAEPGRGSGGPPPHGRRVNGDPRPLTRRPPQAP